MNKRGFLIEIGAVVIILLTTAGVIFTISNAEKLYVGDRSTGKYVNYFKCDAIARNITGDNLEIFKSQKEAEVNFELLEGCV